MLAVGLQSNRILWQQKLIDKSVLESSAIYSKRLRKFYFLSTRWKSDNETELKKGISRITVYLNQIDHDGRNYRAIKINQLNLPGAYVELDKRDRYLFRLRCRTAMGIDHLAAQPYLYFGCSIPPRPTMQESTYYQTVKGVRGVLVRADLNAEGEIPASASDLKTFYPSAVHKENKYGGYDVGIWNSGSGPVLIVPNRLLVSTGNGDFSIDKSSFGCSVLLIDTEKMQVVQKNGRSQVTTYFADGEKCLDSKQIDVSNMHDLSVSTPASVFAGERLYTMIATKKGDVFQIDARNLSGDLVATGNGGRIATEEIFHKPMLIAENDKAIGFTVSSIRKNRLRGIPMSPPEMPLAPGTYFHSFLLQPDQKMQLRWRMTISQSVTAGTCLTKRLLSFLFKRMAKNEIAAHHNACTNS